MSGGLRGNVLAECTQESIERSTGPVGFRESEGAAVEEWVEIEV